MQCDALSASRNEPAELKLNANFFSLKVGQAVILATNSGKIRIIDFHKQKYKQLIIFSEIR